MGGGGGLACRPNYWFISSSFFFASLYARRRLSAGHRLWGVCGEDGRVWSGFSTQMGMYKYGRTWKEVDVGTHTHCLVCVCADSRKSQSNEKRSGIPFWFDGKSKACLPRDEDGARGGEESGEIERKKKREPKNQEPRQPDRQTGARHEN
jgi:hypothetical protein